MKSGHIKFILTSIGLLLCFSLPWIGGEVISWKSLWLSSANYEVDHRILWSLRLPRFLFVLGVGGALAMIGAVYQILFNNSLAEPYILGVSSAVTLGIVIGEVWLQLPSNSLLSLGFGFLSSVAITALLIASYYVRAGREIERIVLFGMGMNFILSSAIFLALFYGTQNGGTGSYRWLFGNIPWISCRDSLLFLSINLPLCFALWLFGRSLDALSLGDSVALTLGTDPIRARTIILFLTSVHLTIITSFTGSIGFLGLVIPHCIRIIYRPASTRKLVTLSFVGGAIFLAFSDSLSRVLLPPIEFPIGIFTTLIGGPLFLYLLWKR